jgi:hypothetical protein
MAPLSCFKNKIVVETKEIEYNRKEYGSGWEEAAQAAE